MTTPRCPKVGLSAAFAILAAAAVAAEAQGIPAADTASHIPLNLLAAPSSPAFVLLGVESTSVERPGSITDVAISLRTATDDFSVLPESYALSVAPWWLTSAADRLTYEDYRSGRSALLRTSTISLATSTGTDATSGQSTTSLGVGLRMSLIQGPIAEDSAYVAQIEGLRAVIRTLADSLSAIQQAMILSDPVRQGLVALALAAPEGSPQRAALDSLREHRTEELAEMADAELRSNAAALAELRERTAAVPQRRTGLNLDLAVGSVFDFLDGDFDRGDFRSLGGWLTVSLEQPWGAALGVARMQWEHAADLTSFDLGARLVVDHTRGLSLSAEGLARVFPNVASRETEWRAALIADYSVGSNRLLSFSFGRDFEGRSASDLILGLNLAMGFGDVRPAR